MTLIVLLSKKAAVYTRRTQTPDREIVVWHKSVKSPFHSSGIIERMALLGRNLFFCEVGVDWGGGGIPRHSLAASGIVDATAPGHGCSLLDNKHRLMNRNDFDKSAFMF